MACYWNLAPRKAHTLVSWRVVALSQDVFLTLLQMLQQHWLGSTVAKSVPVSWNCVWLLSEAPAVTGTCPSSQALAFAGCMPNPLWIQPASQWRMPPREKKHHHHPGASWALLMSSSLVKKEGIGWIGMKWARPGVLVNQSWYILITYMQWHTDRHIIFSLFILCPFSTYLVSMCHFLPAKALGGFARTSIDSAEMDDFVAVCWTNGIVMLVWCMIYERSLLISHVITYCLLYINMICRYTHVSGTYHMPKKYIWIPRPQYKEDVETINMCLESVASSTSAKSSIGVVLAMEEREEGAAGVAGKGDMQWLQSTALISNWCWSPYRKRAE